MIYLSHFSRLFKWLMYPKQMGWSSIFCNIVIRFSLSKRLWNDLSGKNILPLNSPLFLKFIQ